MDLILYSTVFRSKKITKVTTVSNPEAIVKTRFIVRHCHVANVISMYLQIDTLKQLIFPEAVLMRPLHIARDI